MTPRILGTLEQVTKFAFLLVVAGYVSLRAHNNYLGVPMRVAPAAEMYLAEAYVFFVALAVALATVLLALAVPLLLGLLAAYLAARGRGGLAAIGKGLSKSTLVPALLGAVALLATLLLLGAVGDRVDVAVGALDRSSLAPPRSWLFTASAGTAAFCLAASSAVLRMDLDGLPRALWRAIFAVGTVCTLFLPVVFGAVARPLLYPIVQIRLADGPPLCGLLLMHDDSRTMVWRAEAGVGRIVLLAPDAVAALQMEELQDIRAQALFASATPAAFPLCPRAAPGPQAPPAPAPAPAPDAQPR